MEAQILLPPDLDLRTQMVPWRSALFRKAYPQVLLELWSGAL